MLLRRRGRGRPDDRGGDAAPRGPARRGRTAARAGTAGSRCRARYTPPAPFTGTVHGVRIDTPGSLRARPGRRGARRAPRRLMQATLAVRAAATAIAAWARCSQRVPCRHRRQVDRRKGTAAGRPERCAAVELVVAERPQQRLEPGAAVQQQRDGLSRSGRLRPHGVRRIGPVDLLGGVRHAVAAGHPRQPARAAVVALGDVVDAPRPPSTPRRAPAASRLPRCTSGRR